MFSTDPRSSQHLSISQLAPNCNREGEKLALMHWAQIAFQTLKIPCRNENSQPIYEVTISDFLAAVNILEAFKTMAEKQTNLLQCAIIFNSHLNNQQRGVEANREVPMDNTLKVQTSSERQVPTETANSIESQSDVKMEDEASTGSENQSESSSTVVLDSRKPDADGNITTECYNSKYGIAHFKIYHTENRADLKISRNKTALELLSSVESEISNLNQRRGKGVTIANATNTSSFMKNFSKKLGDQFAEYLDSYHKVDAKKIFKDKSSWKLFNKYLEGEDFIETLSTKAFVKIFISFLNSITVEKIDRSKVRYNGLKVCYRVLLEFFRDSCQIIEAQAPNRTISSLKIIKIWPSIELQVKWDSL